MGSKLVRNRLSPALSSHLGTTIAHLRRRDTGDGVADVCGSNNGNTHSSIDITTHYPHDFPHLSGWTASSRTAQLPCLPGHRWRPRWSESTTLRNTSPRYFFFFSPFCESPRPGGVWEIALGIGISDTDINDAICSAGPKTTDTISSGSSRFLCKLVTAG
jgi:hypothetical protein